MAPPTALAFGAGLNARGMVEILIATVGLDLGLLAPTMYSVLVGIAVLTSVITPITLRAAARRADDLGAAEVPDAGARNERRVAKGVRT